MSKKLSDKEKSLSERAVYLFKLACEFPPKFETHVQVLNNNGDTLVDGDNVTVGFREEHRWKEVYIDWNTANLTDAGYKALNLHLSYSTSYFEMKYLETTKQIEIYVRDFKIKIYIDAK